MRRPGELFRAERSAAADWLARREVGLSAREQAEYDQWLADPGHAAAMAQMESAWGFLERPRLAGQAEFVMRGMAAFDRARTRSRRRRVIGFSLGGLAAAAVIALVLLPARWPRLFGPAPARDTISINPEIRVLADGSVVELNEGARITVDFTPGQRNVRLWRGEAHFAVTKNSSRPFVVSVGAVVVRAVGTAFAVRFDPGEVDVLVTEGRVAVERGAESSTAPPHPTGAARSFYVDAGYRLAVPTGLPLDVPLQPRPVSAEEMNRALAWRKARVEFTDTPLADALLQFNRRNQTQLSLADPELGKICISGAYWTDDPEGFARILQSSADLQAVREADGRIVLRRP